MSFEKCFQADFHPHEYLWSKLKAQERFVDRIIRPLNFSQDRYVVNVRQRLRFNSLKGRNVNSEKFNSSIRQSLRHLSILKLNSMIIIPPFIINSSIVGVESHCRSLKCDDNQKVMTGHSLLEFHVVRWTHPVTQLGINFSSQAHVTVAVTIYWWLVQ